MPMLKHFKGRWPEPVVPPGAPTWLHYEVDAAEDIVLRMVEIFEDGGSVRNSLLLENRHGPPCISLVHGPFLEIVDDVGLEESTAETFEAAWVQASDQPEP